MFLFLQLNAMRKQAKPVSGNVSSRRGRPANLQLQYQQQHQQQSSNNLNETFVVDERANTKQASGMVTPTGKGINGLPATRRLGPGKHDDCTILIRTSLVI